MVPRHEQMEMEADEVQQLNNNSVTLILNQQDEKKVQWDTVNNAV